jgi:hypothetical protein
MSPGMLIFKNCVTRATYTCWNSVGFFLHSYFLSRLILPLFRFVPSVMQYWQSAVELKVCISSPELRVPSCNMEVSLGDQTLSASAFYLDICQFQGHFRRNSKTGLTRRSAEKMSCKVLLARSVSGRRDRFRARKQWIQNCVRLVRHGFKPAKEQKHLDAHVQSYRCSANSDSSPTSARCARSKTTIHTHPADTNLSFMKTEGATLHIQHIQV